MTKIILLAALLSSAAFAQTSISPPAAGAVRDLLGNLRPVAGVAGNFVMADSVFIENVLSMGFAGTAGLVKTGTELLVLDGAFQIRNRFSLAGRQALFAFDAKGAPALVYASGALFRFEDNDLKPVNWTGAALSIAMSGSETAVVMIRRGRQLRKLCIRIPSGEIESETPLEDVRAPLLLLADGRLLFGRGGDIVLRDANGAEQYVPAAFEIDAFEMMDRNWIAVRSGRTIFALDTGAQNPHLYQLPEMSQ